MGFTKSLKFVNLTRVSVYNKTETFTVCALNCWGVVESGKINFDLLYRQFSVVNFWEVHTLFRSILIFIYMPCSEDLINVIV